MTIPKNAGLSHLADVANPIEHYPVKRRGQRRRLDPNWDAIRWLEDETHDDTEIASEAPLDDGMIRLTALGWYGAKQRNMYPRRMFDVFELEASSTNLVTYTPCEACDNYAYTWACTEHPEITRGYTDITRGYTDMGTDGLRPPEGLYDWLMEMYPQAVRPVELRLHIRDSDTSYEATVLRDDREMQEAVMTEASREAARTGWPVRGQVLGRWARVHADGRIIFEQRPEEIGRYARSFWENGRGLVRRQTSCTCPMCTQNRRP